MRRPADVVPLVVVESFAVTTMFRGEHGPSGDQSPSGDSSPFMVRENWT